MTSVNCRRARSLLMAWLDSELDATTTVAVGEHLATCPACRARFEAEGRLEAALAGIVRQGTMPADVTARLEARLAGRPRRQWRWLAAAAVVLVAAWLAVLDTRDPAGDLDLKARMVALHEAFRSGSLVPAARDGPAAEALLAAHHLGGLPLPPDGMVEGHALRFVGADARGLDGVPAVELFYDCCGALASVVVTRASAVQGAPATGALPQGTTDDDGVRLTSFTRDGLYVAVLSRHETALPAYWRD